MPAMFVKKLKNNIHKQLIIIDFICSRLCVRQKLTLANEACRQLFNNNVLLIRRFTMTMPKKQDANQYHGQAEPLTHAQAKSEQA
jgi:hypothetical protein